MSPPVPPRASDALRDALVAQARSQRRRAPVYLNARARAAGNAGRWLSDVGFLSAAPFAYSEAHATNFIEGDASEPRAVRRLVIVPYGLGRDLLRLTSDLPADRAIRTSRTPGASGRAPWPGLDTVLGAADLNEDSSVPEKTSSFLAQMGNGGSGIGFHAVITRTGAVFICAPLDAVAAPFGTSADDPEDAIFVAVESAGAKLRQETKPPQEVPLASLQADQLAIFVAKVRAAYPEIPLAWASPGLAYAVLPVDQAYSQDTRNFREWGTWGDTANALPEFDYTAVRPENFLARVGAEPAYTLATEVFRQGPAPSTRRANALTTIGHADTLGTQAILLGSYGDLAAGDRSDGMQEETRRDLFVRRARAAHRESDTSAAGAAHASSAEALTPVIPSVSNASPHAYNYSTGLWGDGEPW